MEKLGIQVVEKMRNTDNGEAVDTDNGEAVDTDNGEDRGHR